jgi:chemotaxis protein CheX
MSNQLSQETIVGILNHTTADVLTTMLGMGCEPGAPYEELRTSGTFEGVISFIGMAGEWVGNGSIHCTSDVACKLASKFLMCDFSSVNEEVLDAIGELTNMIFGGLKNDIEEYTGPLGLSIPTVIHGKNFSARSLGHEAWIVVPFDCEGSQMIVRLCLKRNDNAARHHPGAEKREFVLQP